MKCPRCERRVVGFSEWFRYSWTHGFERKRGYRCSHCNIRVHGTGLNRQADIALVVSGVFGAAVALFLGAPRSDRASNMDFWTFWTLTWFAILWLVFMHFAAWYFGRYQEIAAVREPAPAPDANGEFVSVLEEARVLTIGRVSYQVREITGQRSYYLVVASGPLQGLPIRISTDVFLLGAHDACHYVNKALAERHCLILSQPGKVLVRDLNSSRATYVRGEVLVPGGSVALNVGDLMEISGLELALYYRETPLSKTELIEWAMHCLEGDADRLYGEQIDVFRGQRTTASVAAQDIMDRIQEKRGRRLVFGDRVHIEQLGDVTLVRFRLQDIVEELDITMIRKQLADANGRLAERVLLSFKNVHRVSDAGVFMLVDVCRQLRHQGTAVATCRIKPELFEKLEPIHALRIPYFESKNAALTAAKW